MNKILIIDDDQDILALLRRFLSKSGYEVETTHNGTQGEKMLDSFNPDLVMCDYRLDDMDGSVLLAKIKEKKPDLPVIIITGYSDLRTAVKVVRLGAFDYITKPFIPDEILLNIRQALNQTNNPATGAKSVKSKSGSLSYLFSNSLQSKHLEQQIALVAPTDYSVIIYGESGAGKEGVAKAIHEKSNRAGKPFVAMDCGAISKELAGSELFGHEKGSFTGALNQKIGHFEMAEGGTLFLDEIGNLPYEVQTLLLRVLQEKVLRRIGGNKEMRVDVRILVASNEKLIENARTGKFREDLYHRLNEFHIEVLPLRKRKEDIMFFADHFLRETSAELHKDIVGFDPEVQEVFINYPWYGNVRELKNVIKRAALLSTKDTVDLKSIPFEILNHARISFDPEEKDTYTHVPTPIPVTHHAPIEAEKDLSKSGMKKAALEAEYEMILDALTKANFNRSKAAVILGIDRKTLYNKMKQMKMADK
ncbi:MAG: sigma-54-dependent Fis family transcriptional regulator [Bacteroidetes bacterium]|nr:sigma-54-dependent Fis family transcriptional regulator [Bacteroidota bacterium]